MTRLRRLPWIILVLALPLLLSLPRTAAGCECDSAKVVHGKGAVLVYPTGTDDTANLRCVLKAASRTRGQVIELQAGQFYSQPLWATGFVGTLRGAGRDQTILSNRGTLELSQAVDAMSRPPSEDNVWAAFLLFIGGDFTVSDLTIKMIGPQLATDYYFLGQWPIFNNIMGEIVVTGEAANAAIRRVTIEGATIDEGMMAPHGEVVATFFQPVSNGYATPLSGRFEVADCGFKNVNQAFNVGVVSHAQVQWQGNTVEGGRTAFEMWELEHTVVQVTGNKLQGEGWGGFGGLSGVYGGPVYSSGSLNHAVVNVVDNQFSGPSTLNGLEAWPLATDKLTFFAAGNKFEGTAGIVLGSDSHGLIVKAGDAVVNDLSGANHVLR